MEYRNVIGEEVRKLRVRLKMSQEDLATKLQIAGLDWDRSQVSKMEGRTLRVHDHQLVFLAEVLKVTIMELYPSPVLVKPAQQNVLGALERKPSKCPEQANNSQY